MKVLIISANFLPASPAGPAYIAGAALEAGHEVEIFEALVAKDLIGELKAHLDKFSPEVVAISIRLVHGFILDENAQYGTRHLDLRTKVTEIVECSKQNGNAQIVLGGPGFNYYGPDWLEYLNLDYGIRGEADHTFPLYLKPLQAGGDLDTVPGSVYRSKGRIRKSQRAYVEDLDTTAMPAYQLFDLDRYYSSGISPAIPTKRDCAFNCSYCASYQDYSNGKESILSARHLHRGFAAPSQRLPGLDHQSRHYQ